MRAGRLQQRITFQAKVASRNDYGDEVITWADQTTVWAEAIPQSQSKEIFTADQPHAEALVIFKVRYLSTVVPEWRLLWGGIVYEILSVQNVKGEFKELEVLSRGGVSNV